MSFEEQIMSKGKHPSKFSGQMAASVLIILKTFFATRALKSGEYIQIECVLFNESFLFTFACFSIPDKSFLA